jgi:hypothetical protein
MLIESEVREKRSKEAKYEHENENDEVEKEWRTLVSDYVRTGT